MIIGVPKEIKPQENRIGLTPESVKVLTSSGHKVLIENNGGFEAGFYNNQYIKAGAKIVDNAQDIFNDSEIIVKVKEPLRKEIDMIKENQIIFTYLHLAAAKGLTEGLIKSKSVCIAYETVTDDNGRLPLLAPMSAVAGRMSIQAGAHSLESDKVDLKKLISECVLLIGGVLIPGAEAPKLITKDMLKVMKRGSVIVDVAIDQGGCVETSKPTTHADPTYIVDDIVHYCVANMPGGVPRTSTLALNKATLPFLCKLADKGYEKALKEDKNFLEGLNVFKGQITHKAVAKVFGHEYISPKEALLNV